LDWKKYTPSGCRWTKPFSSGSGTCVVEFQLWYKWDNPDTAKRTIKFYTKLVLYEYAYYLQVNAAGATRENQQTGYRMKIGINSGTMVNAISSIQEDPKWGQASYGSHTLDLCSTSKTLSYKDNGTVNAIIDYDLYMKWYSINQGSIKSIDAKGSYKVTDVPKIETTKISSIAFTSNSVKETIYPNKVNYTNIDNTKAQYVDAGNTIILKAAVAGYSSKEKTVNFTVKPTTAKGNLTITSSNTQVASAKSSKIDVTKANSFILLLKEPGTTTITAKSDSNKVATLNCTISANKNIAWNSSNLAVASVSKGTVVTKTGISGYTNIKALAVGNTSASNTVITNVLLPPTNINVTSNKNSIYPGETIGYTITVEPYSAENSAVRVSSNYRGTKYEIDSITNTHSTVILNNGASRTDNKYNISYTFNNYTIPSEYVSIAVNSTYKSSIQTKVSVPVKAPTLDVDKTALQVVKGSNTNKTITVTTMPANSPFSYTYDKNYISVSKSGNVLTVKGVNNIQSTPIVITGNMPIITSLMNKPTKTVNVTVGSAPITRIFTSPATLTSTIGISNVAFTDNLEEYYSEATVKKTAYSAYNNESYQINTIVGTTPKTLEFIIKFEPLNASDTIYMVSNDESIVSIPNEYKEIYTGNGTGNGQVKVKITCNKVGNTYITLTSESSGIKQTVNVNCTLNSNVTVESNNRNIVNIGTSVVAQSNSGLGKQFVGTTSEFNGTTNITVRSAVDTSKKYTLPFNCWLKPTAIDVTADKTNVYVGDTIKFNVLLKPYNSNDSSRTTAKQLSGLNYKLVTDKGTQFDTLPYTYGKYSNNISYKVPDESIFSSEKCKYFKLVVSSDYNDNIKGEVKIYFKQQGISIDGSTSDIYLYLANTDNSYKEFNVSIEPPSGSYYFTPPTIESETSGIDIYLKDNDESYLKITGSKNRNLTVNGRTATKFETAYNAGNPHISDVKGFDLTLHYQGQIISSGNTEVTIHEYTCEYFNYPKIINAIPDKNNPNTYSLDYYGDRPKFYFQLPTKNDFTILKNINIKFPNGTYYVVIPDDTHLKGDADNFSAAYSTWKYGHNELTSMIVDYVYPKNDVNGIPYTTFVPSYVVPNGYVTITYESTFPETIPSATIKVYITKKELPKIPEIGSPIKLNEVKSFIQIVEKVLSPYYNGNNDLFDSKSMLEVLYGVSTNTLSSIGKVGERISSMPFFKVLFALYSTINRLSEAINVIGPDKIPQFLDYIKPRLMLATDNTRNNWYNNKSKTKYDDKLYSDYHNLFNKDLLDPITNENYPIMVDDSNDYVGNPDKEIPNIYKTTALYNQYTISPITEIVNALKQL